MSREAIRDLVHQECERSAFGLSFFEEHLTVVADHASRLAEQLGADRETVEVAAWLHDLAAVRDPAPQPDHDRLCAELAPEVLSSYGYDNSVVASISCAIASHSFPRRLGDASLEEVCLSQADATSQIARPIYWFYFGTTFRGLGYEDGKEWLLNRLETKWKALIEPARELVGDRYESVIGLFRQG